MTERHEAPYDGGESGRIRETFHDAGERVADAAREVRHRGGRLVHEGVDKGRDLAGEARHAVMSRMADGKDRLAEGMHAMARALRRSGEEFSEEQRSYARIVEGLADRVDGAARFLDRHGVDELGREATRFAREHAAIVLGSAFALGMLGARFLKSGREEMRHGPDVAEPTLRGAVEPYRGESHLPPGSTGSLPPFHPRQGGDGHAH